MISSAIDLSISNNSKKLNIIETMSRATKWINYGKFKTMGYNTYKATASVVGGWAGGIFGGIGGSFKGSMIGIEMINKIYNR